MVNPVITIPIKTAPRVVPQAFGLAIPNTEVPTKETATASSNREFHALISPCPILEERIKPPIEAKTPERT
jgi:hypothetical protein